MAKRPENPKLKESWGQLTEPYDTEFWDKMSADLMEADSADERQRLGERPTRLYPQSAEPEREDEDSGLREEHGEQPEDSGPDLSE